MEIQSYEVEVKSLLGSEARAAELRAKMEHFDPNCLATVERNKQLNHYFEGSTLAELSKVVASHLSENARAKLADITARAKTFSLRTRDKDGTVILVVKASADDTTSENGIARIEFEETVPMTIDELDTLILSAGFTYQAKWSREREEYTCNGMAITLDKNAGYGWVAEFEKIVDADDKTTEAAKEIRAFMKKLGAEELPQDRLKRMFEHYNTHWREYYGTDKIFVIE